MLIPSLTAPNNPVLLRDDQNLPHRQIVQHSTFFLEFSRRRNFIYKQQQIHFSLPKSNLSQRQQFPHHTDENRDEVEFMPHVIPNRNARNAAAVDDIAEYEDLIQLEDVKVPVKPNLLATFRVERYRGIPKMCHYCGEKVDYIITPPCRHSVHLCVKENWFSQKHTCPECMRDLNDETLYY